MGVQEKKRVREINEYLEAEGNAAVKNAVGNDGATVEFNHDESMEAQKIRIAGDNIKEVIEGLVKTCEDQDYKEEIGKVNKFVFNAKPEVQKDPNQYIYTELNIEGDTMTFGVDGTHSASNGSTDNMVKLIQSKF